MLCLVADDHEDVRELLSNFLRATYGGEVHTAADGLVARDMLSARRYDLLICDLHMPGAGGVEVLRHLRVLGRRPPTLVVAISGDPDALRSLDGHPDVGACFLKPVSLAVLRLAVDRLRSGPPSRP